MWNLWLAITASIFMPRSLAKLKLQTNFNAIFKNAKILKIGPVKQKLWKIRQIVGVKFNKRTAGIRAYGWEKIQKLINVRRTFIPYPRVRTSLLRRIYKKFFQLWWLAILEPVGVHRHNVPHFKGLIVLYMDLRSSRVWQHFYLLSCPFEKGHFTPINGQRYDIHFLSLYIIFS